MGHLLLCGLFSSFGVIMCISRSARKSSVRCQIYPQSKPSHNIRDVRDGVRSDGVRDGVRSCNQTSDVGLHGEILTALTAPRPRHTTISVVESERLTLRPRHPSSRSILTAGGERAHQGPQLGLLEGVGSAHPKSEYLLSNTCQFRPNRAECNRL